MGFNKSLLLMVSLSCIVLGAHAAAVAPPTTAAGGGRKSRPLHATVVNICSKTSNPRICMETVLPHVKGGFTPYKALEAEVNATMAQVDVTLKALKSILAKPQRTPRAKRVLEICEEMYEAMVSSIDASLKEVMNRTLPIESKYKMSGVISYDSSCSDNFENEVSPIENEQKLLKAHAGNCLDIIAYIEERELRRVLRRFGNKLPPPPPAITSDTSDPCFYVVGSCNY